MYIEFTHNDMISIIFLTVLVCLFAFNLRVKWELCLCGFLHGQNLPPST